MIVIEALGEDWNETTHPKAKEHFKNREFKNTETGNIIMHHLKDKNGKDKPYWHRLNPEATSKSDSMLDKKSNPCPKVSKATHIYY